MGCVNSAAKVDDPKAKEEEARQQRRRLSVAPQHVGDIDPSAAKDKDKPQDAKSAPPAVSAPAEPAAPTDAETKGKGNMRHISLSRKGFVPYNRNKVNQDREIIKFGLQNDPGLSLFGVMDGHGEFGHFVANFVKERLPEHLQHQGNLRSDPPAAITKAVKELVDELAGTNINIAFSGTTAVFGLKVDQSIYVANIGDSRCVLARKSDSGAIEAVPLSTDQKPESPDEKARIIKAGGRVEPLPGPPGEDCGPPRVWLAEVDVPGLAMSRSIGDEVSQTVGVISVPEIRKHDIDATHDILLIWATDGVWEFISNQEAVDTVLRSRTLNDELSKSANDLVALAHERWTKEEEVVDDITTVILDFGVDHK